MLNQLHINLKNFYIKMCTKSRHLRKFATFEEFRALKEIHSILYRNSQYFRKIMTFEVIYGI